MARHALSFIWVLVIVSLWPAVAFSQVPITVCGQFVDSGGGILMNDLDCTGLALAAIDASRGTVDLNGYTVTGGISGVHCSPSCTVIGPGTVTGAEQDGVTARNSSSSPKKSKLTIENVTTTGNGRALSRI